MWSRHLQRSVGLGLEIAPRGYRITKTGYLSGFEPSIFWFANDFHGLIQATESRNVQAMATEEFTVSSVIPASPNRIYSAWMDERHHTAFTGARATVDPWVGGRIVAHDGLVDATHVYLVTGSRIAMTWRTRDFPKGANDSRVDITFEPIAGGTKVEVTHAGIPEGLGDACKQIWRTQYLDPMKKYFTKPGAMRAAYSAAKKAGHLPLSGIKASRPAPRRPFVPPPQLPVEDEVEDEEEQKPKKIRPRVESKTIDLRELARAQAVARKEAAIKKAEAKRKAETVRRQAEADRKKAEDQRKAEQLRQKKAEVKRKAAEKKTAAARKKAEAKRKADVLKRKKAAQKKKADVLKRKKAAQKKKADVLKRKKAAQKKKVAAKKKAAAKKKKAAAKRRVGTRRRAPAKKRRGTKKRPVTKKPRATKKRPAQKKRAAKKTTKRKPVKKRKAAKKAKRKPTPKKRKNKNKKAAPAKRRAPAKKAKRARR